MARILISEPHELVRGMLERIVSQLGHEPVLYAPLASERLAAAELVIVEPGALAGAALAQAAGLVAPDLPLISASVAAPPAELQRLGVVFVASLVKPYTVEELREAIVAALAQSKHIPPPTAWRPWPLREDRAA